MNGVPEEVTGRKHGSSISALDNADDEGEDTINNRLQRLVLLQFLEGQPTAISPGTLRYIASEPRR